jgi:hypothetical protein
VSDSREPGNGWEVFWKLRAAPREGLPNHRRTFLHLSDIGRASVYRQRQQPDYQTLMSGRRNVALSVQEFGI